MKISKRKFLRGAWGLGIGIGGVKKDTFFSIELGKIQYLIERTSNED